MTKRKYVFRILLSIGLMVFILAVVGLAVLRSQAFHRYVLAKMVAQASQATGGRVEIGSFQFRWHGLALDLNRVVLHGTETASSAPLLQIDHLKVGLKIISLWRRKIDLNEIVMDHPSIHLDVNPSGGTNLPQPPAAAPGAAPTNIFDLAIGYFVINQGELDYNDRHLPLAAEVHDLYAQVGFDSLQKAYRGTLDYREGRIQFGSLNPVQHNIRARFGATPSGLALDSLVLEAGASNLSFEGHIQNYRNPSVDGSYQGVVATGELGEILKASSMPVGLVDIQGTVHYANRAGEPLLNSLDLAGKFHAQALAINLPQARTSVRALTGDYHLSGGTLEASNVRAGVLGGAASGNLTLAHLAERPVGQVEATLRDISIEAAGAATGATQVARSAISGKLDGALKASWEGSGDNLQIHSDATIVASALAPKGAGPGANQIPLTGALHIAYNGPTGALTLSHTTLSTPHTTLALDGSTGKQSSLSIQANSDDLREVDQLALIARNAGGTGRPPSPAPALFGISGAGAFNGQLRGSMSAPRLTGQLSGTNVQYQGTTLTELRASVGLSPSAITLSQGEIQTSDRAQVQFNVQAGLKNWSYTPASQVRVDLTAARVPVATVERLANLHYPVTGTLGARVSVHGTQTDLTGQGFATLTQATVWNQPIQNLSVQFQGAGASVSSSVQLQTPAGSGSGKLTYNFRTKGYTAQFSTSNLELDKLEALKHGRVPVTGILSASLAGSGTLRAPLLKLSAQAPKLAIENQTFDGMKLEVNVAQQKATLALDTAAQGASIQARANVNLDANYDAIATVDLRNVQLGPLLASFAAQAPAGLHGQAELHGTLHGPLKQPRQVEAEVEIPTLNLAYQSVQIGNAAPIRAVYRGGVVSIEQCNLKGTGTDVQLQATVPVEHVGSLQAKATGNVDLHLVQLLYPDWQTGGQVRLDVAADGAFAHPNVHGTVRLEDAVLQAPDAPLGAQKLNATLAIQNNRVDIQSFTGEAAGGTLTASGFATLQPAVQFNVRLSAKEVRLRYPVGTRAILNSTLLLTGSPDSSLLTGQVVVERLSLTKEFDLSTFADQFNGSSSASPGPGFAQNLKLNVALNSASEMGVESSQLSVQGSANLMVRGTAAEPVILGRTDITGGEVFYNGQRFKVESGMISFVNPVQTEPMVNLHVTANVNQFDISMNVAGPIDRLRINYTSDPPLAPVDIINLIATGQTTEAAAANPSSPQSVIAGQLSSQVSNRVQKLAGISSLTIDPNFGGTQGNGVARLGVQQRVTKNLYFSFSTDLTNSSAQVVQVEYQLTPKYAVSTMRDQNGIYTVEVKLHKRF